MLPRKLDKLELDSRKPVKKCPLGCGSNHSLDDSFVPTCYACVMELGCTTKFEDIDKMMPTLVQTWKRHLNDLAGEKAAAKKVVQALQAKVSEQQFELQEKDAQLKAFEAKVSELQAKMLSRFQILDI